MLEEAPFSLDILPSTMMDIVRTQYFYDSIERGLGSVFRDYIVGRLWGDTLEAVVILSGKHSVSAR